jgi:hypothetical protein
MNGIGHAVYHRFHLGSYRSEVIGGAHDQTISVQHLLVKGLKVVLLQALPFLVADPTGIAEFYIQLADVHQFRTGALRSCPV